MTIPWAERSSRKRAALVCRRARVRDIRRPEALDERGFLPQEHIGGRSHTAGNEHRLAGKSPCRSLAMDDNLFADALYFIFLDFGDIMRDIINHGKLRRLLAEHPLEGF